MYLKPEMLQYTGAFKLRGALAKTLALTPEQRAKGIICSSSGNHARPAPMPAGCWVSAR